MREFARCFRHLSSMSTVCLELSHIPRVNRALIPSHRRSPVAGRVKEGLHAASAVPVRIPATAISHVSHAILGQIGDIDSKLDR